MQVYNTLTRKKEELIPEKPGEFKLYACGPTVYNYIHIGNARPICVFDTLRKYLEYLGNRVIFVQNFTDVDDKIIKKAQEEGVTPGEVAEKFIKEYEIDAKGLGVKPATIHPKVTETMDEIIHLIERIVKKGFGYVTTEGDVYFRSTKFESYGKLSKQDLEGLESGVRVEVKEEKESPLDFALWKSAKEGEPYWESPFSKGRPGWHIECTAMIEKYLGESIDIHCGGQDLIFPHHENEIAQGECVHEKPYAKYWMHNGYINIDNKKMSKSAGNFFTTRDVAEKYGYEPIRFMMIASHYRNPIQYSLESIESAQNGLARLYDCRESLVFAIEQGQEEGEDTFISLGNEGVKKYKQAMDDDLNTADALAEIFNLVKEINITLRGEKPQSKKGLTYMLTTLDDLCGILGILQKRAKGDITEEIEQLLEQRKLAREEKNYQKSDEIRDKLKEMGVTIKDTPTGVTYKIEEN